MKDTLITVNVTYARIALILLAANLLLTGYTINKIQAANDVQPTPVTSVDSQASNAGGYQE